MELNNCSLITFECFNNEYIDVENPTAGQPPLKKLFTGVQISQGNSKTFIASPFQFTANSGKYVISKDGEIVTFSLAQTGKSDAQIKSQMASCNCCSNGEVVAVVQAESGLNFDEISESVRLGGPLLEDVVVDGQEEFRLEFADMRTFKANTKSVLNTAEAFLELSYALSVPSSIRTQSVANNNIFGLLQVDADTLSQFIMNESSNVWGVQMHSGDHKVQMVSNTQVMGMDDVGGFFMKTLRNKSTETQVIYIDSNGYLAKGTISGGGSVLYQANVIGTGFAVGTKCLVNASGAGITFEKLSATEWRFNIPTGVELYGFALGLKTADNFGSSTYVKFTYADAGSRPYNQLATGLDARVPLVNGINLGSNGTAISRGNVQPFTLTTGTNNISVNLTLVSGGNSEIEIVNANSATGVGSADTMIYGYFQ